MALGIDPSMTDYSEDSRATLSRKLTTTALSTTADGWI